MTFSVIMPCYREQVSDVRKNLAIMDGYFDFKPEYLIMENGSQLLYAHFNGQGLSEDYPDHRFNYFWHHSPGLGWALKEGLRHATWPYVFFLPADNSYDLSFVKQATAYLETGYSIVIGSKGMSDSIVKRPFKRKAISKGYNLALRALYGPDWPSDITGVKAYNKREILPLTLECDSDGIYFEVQLMKKIIDKGLRSKEIAVSVNDFRPSPFNLFGKDRAAHD